MVCQIVLLEDCKAKKTVLKMQTVKQQLTVAQKASTLKKSRGKCASTQPKKEMRGVQ